MQGSLDAFNIGISFRAREVNIVLLYALELKGKTGTGKEEATL